MEGKESVRIFAPTRIQEIKMKLAIPSETADGLKSMRSGHFGHTPYFTVIDIENGEIKSVEPVKNVDHDTVGCGGVIDFALSLGIDAMLTVGMGRPPLTRFTNSGVKVYSERETPIVGDAAAKFIAGECALMSIDDACAHH